MWGMIGLSPDWLSQIEENGEQMSCDSDDAVHVGDIVIIATRSKRPVLLTSANFDDTAQLRVLGEMKNERTTYLCLITAGDAEHVTPTVVVGRQTADYGADEYFHGCDGIIVSEFHLRGIAKKQRGRFCDKCTEYNEDVRISLLEPYLCLTCRQNPWR